MNLALRPSISNPQARFFPSGPSPLNRSRWSFDYRQASSRNCVPMKRIHACEVMLELLSRPTWEYSSKVLRRWLCARRMIRPEAVKRGYKGCRTFCTSVYAGQRWRRRTVSSHCSRTPLCGSYQPGRQGVGSAWRNGCLHLSNGGKARCKGGDRIHLRTGIQKFIRYGWRAKISERRGCDLRNRSRGHPASF